MARALKTLERWVSDSSHRGQVYTEQPTYFALIKLVLSFQEIMVGSQYQAEVPTGLCTYGDGEKGGFWVGVELVLLNIIELWIYSKENAHEQHFLYISEGRNDLVWSLCFSQFKYHGNMCFCFSSVYEDEDQLLWSPGFVAESKVKEFLCQALSRATEGRSDSGECKGHVRDNEQVRLTPL